MKHILTRPFSLFLLGMITLFSSCNSDDNLATTAVSTESVFQIMVDGAICRGFINSSSDIQFTGCGICWSTNSNPTILDSIVSRNERMDEFADTLRRLVPATTYYVRAYATYAPDKVEYGNVLAFQTPAIPEITMITIPGGSYTMGGLLGSISPQHQVIISTFQMGATEITQGNWKALMGNEPSYFKGADLPVESVNMSDIQAFIQKLNTFSGKSYRLPREAEWEFAAGGGVDTSTLWAGTNTSDSIGKYFWYSLNSNSKTHPVATKRPNTLGLYDMSGNVWEWCSDIYGSYSSAPQTDPTGPLTGGYRVIRGGSWAHDGNTCEKVTRSYNYPDDRKSSTGFRLVLRP